MMKFKNPLLKALFALGLMRLSVDDSGAGGTPPTPPAGKAQTFSYEYVQELREENKSLRLANRDLTTKNTELTGAAEKAAKEADDKIKASDTAASERILRAELKAHALKAGLVDLDGLKLADLSKVKLKEDGSLDGAEQMFADLKTAKPYLFGAANSSTPNDPPPNKPPEAKKATEIKDPKEYADAKSQFLKANGG